MTYQIETSSAAGTRAQGRRLARFLLGGEVIELISDLGGGKTTFMQGVANGLGFNGPVTSPTFTLSNVYRLPTGKEIHHYDLFRTGPDEVLASELAEDAGHPDIYTVIEWPYAVASRLPPDHLIITLEVTSKNGRLLKFEAPGPVSLHLISELKK